MRDFASPLSGFSSPITSADGPAEIGPSLILDQTHTNYNGAGDNGSFTGGSAGGGVHDVGATITLENGATVLVTAQSGSPNGRAVAGFTITSISPATAGETYFEDNAANGFSITPGTNNVA